MKKNLRFWSLLAALLVSGFAWADNGTYSGHVEQDCRSDYSTSTISFSLVEMANYFGVDPSQFASDLKAFIEADKATYKTDDNSDKTLYIRQIVNGGEFVFPNADQTYSANLGSYYCGFWMTDASKPVSYGSDAAWYWLVQADEALGEVQFLIGQMPNYWADGGKPSCDLQLVYKGKEANITLTAEIAPKPVVDVEMQFSKLNIAGSVDVTVEQYPRKNYDADDIIVAANDIVSALDISNAASFVEYVSAYVFTQRYESDLWVDSISNNFTATPTPGFWFAETYDEETGGILSQCALHDFSGSKFYLAGIGVNEAADSIKFSIGQMPSTLNAGETWKCTYYYVYKSNAYAVNITLNIIQRDTAGDPDLATFKKVGEMNVEQSTTTLSDYLEINTPINNMEEIATALGDEVGNITFWHLTSEDGTVLADDLDDGWGTWVNEKGVPSGWNDNAAIMIAYEMSDGTYYISTLQMAGGKVLNEQEVVEFPVFFVSEVQGTYYTVNFKYTYEKPSHEDEDSIDIAEWKVVEVQNYDVQLIQSETYSQKETTQLNLEGILTALKASAIEADWLYTFKDEVNEWIPESMTQTYNCTPYPGFWMSENGKTSLNWTASCAYGMTLDVSSGVVKWYAHHDGTHQAGETYNGVFFIASPFSGNIVQLNFNIEYVTERVSIEDVGEEDVAFVLSADNLSEDGLYTIDIDMTNACEAIGIDISEIESVTWYALNNSGSFSAVESFEGEDCVFDESGAMAAIDSENAKFAVGYDYDNNTLVASLLGEDPTEETLYTTRIALRNGSKRYIFNIKLGSEEALSIDNVKMTSKNTQFFDLSGRAVKNPTKGFYIANGTKVLVK